MQRPNTKTRLAISWLCLALAACSSDKHHSVLVITGMDDDGGAADGGEKDGAAPDAGADHTLVSMGTTLCAYDDADRYEAGREARADVLSAAASQAGFGLLYQRSDGALFVQATGLSGKPESAHALVAASEHASSPLLVANDKDFAVVYRSSSASAELLLTRSLTGSPTAAPNVLTRDLDFEAARGEPWSVAPRPGGFVASWLDGSDGQARVRTLDASAAISGSPRALANLASTPLERLRLARMSNGTLILAFGTTDAAGDDALFGQVLAPDLAAQGNPSPLSKNPVLAAPFGLAARADSAGLLYAALDGGVRQALKLRRIGSDGLVQGPVLNVANAPRVVNAGSLTAFGRGYALVYRELPSLGMDHSAVRIAFVNPFGSVVYDAELAQLTGSDVTADSATAVAATSADALLVSWTEADADATKGSHVHALRMHCPGALILCGGKVQ